jgi:transposase
MYNQRMPRIRFQITEAQAQELQRGYQAATDAANRTRCQALRLYSEGYAVPAICQITGCSRSSLMNWWHKYRQQGLSGLDDHRDGRNRAKLTQAQIQEVTEKLHQYSPHDLFGWQTQTASGQHWLVEDLARAVDKWYGIRWDSRTSYHTLFAQCGFSYQRSEKVYKSRRERDVLDFEAVVEKK